MHRLLLLLTLTSACGAGSSYMVSASTSPDLVYVAPGVYAVSNADAPVFYADDYYWLYADDIWYRSSYLDGGWHYAPAPYSVRMIERPRAYVRYSRYRPDRRVHIDVRDRYRYRSDARDRYRYRSDARDRYRTRQSPYRSTEIDRRSRVIDDRDRRQRTRTFDRREVPSRARPAPSARPTRVIPRTRGIDRSRPMQPRTRAPRRSR